MCLFAQEGLRTKLEMLQDKYGIPEDARKDWQSTEELEFFILCLLGVDAANSSRILTPLDCKTFLDMLLSKKLAERRGRTGMNGAHSLALISVCLSLSLSLLSLSLSFSFFLYLTVCVRARLYLSFSLSLFLSLSAGRTLSVSL